MEYPFKAGYEYFKPAEQKHIDAFLASGTKTGLKFTNKDGETREVMRIDLPTGVITEQTVWLTERGAKEKRYHTPCATVSESREAMVSYRNSDGSWGRVKSSEWLKWVGKEPKVEEPVVVKAIRTPAEEQRIAAMVKQNQAVTTGNDKFSEGAQWSKPGAIRKTN